MVERTRAAERAELMAAVFDVINAAMEDGERAGKRVDEWLEESAEHHLDHAIEHVSQYYALRDMTDLTHCICRLLMHLIVNQREGSK